MVLVVSQYKVMGPGDPGSLAWAPDPSFSSSDLDPELRQIW